jgi:hypothetical protein
LAPIFLAQFDGNVPPEIGAPDPDIDRDVQYLAAHRADELALGRRVLQVQPAKNTKAGTGKIILDEWADDAMLDVSAQLIGFDEETTLIAE